MPDCAQDMDQPWRQDEFAGLQVHFDCDYLLFGNQE